MRERLAFFDLTDDPAEVRSRVSVGYVPGLVDPVVIVPYLRAHSGTDAVSAYAKSLLAGRPELWPAVAGHATSPPSEPPNAFADHGTQLAGALMADELAALAVPKDVVRSTVRSAKALRSSLRAAASRLGRGRGGGVAAPMRRRRDRRGA